MTKNKQFPVLLTENEMKALSLQAGKEDVSKGEVIRKALAEYIKKGD